VNNSHFATHNGLALAAHVTVEYQTSLAAFGIPHMTVALRFAETDADREAIYRLRYEIYVEDMGYTPPGVDHRNRRLASPLERPTRRLMAEDDDTLVGTLQFNWGAERAFTEEERRNRLAGLERPPKHAGRGRGLDLPRHGTGGSGTPGRDESRHQMRVRRSHGRPGPG
jgi:hypothetical protein